MFKNFDKVFRFTLKNQLSASSYKRLTFIIAFIFFAIPVAIFIIGDRVNQKDDEVLKPCNAEIIYVVNEATPDRDYNMLNLLGVEGYEDIKYINAKSVDNALSLIKGRDNRKCMILEFTVDKSSVSSRIVIPSDSEINKDDAENYNKFIEENTQIVSLVASGVTYSNLVDLAMQVRKDVYDITGFKTGTSLFEDKDAVEDDINKKLMPTFNLVITIVSSFLMYFIIMYYGNGIMQNIVLEKHSKLMDTMLISVKPEAMIFGKMLGVLLAALIQFLSWILSLILGVVCGVKLIDIIRPDSDMVLYIFLKSILKMNFLKPVNIVIAILVLLFGIVFYSSISSIAGAISSTNEEAASNQSVFIIILIVSFYIVLFGGLRGDEVATWMYMVPSTGAMLLPAGICTGNVSTLVASVSLLIMIITTVFLIYLAGRLYKMMSLYKGNKVNLGKALKMLKNRA